MNSANFDLISPVYDRLARLVFGQAIRNSQTCFLKDIPDRARILSLGGGTGWWLPLLRSQKPESSIVFVDSSRSMIRKAAKNADGLTGVEFVHGTITDVTLLPKFDVIFTFYFLDLFEEEELRNQLKEIANRASADALWLIADFVNEKRWHTFMLSVMYSFFQITTGMKTRSLPAWESAIKSFVTTQESKSFYGSFIRSHKAKIKTPDGRDYQPMP